MVSLCWAHSPIFIIIITDAFFWVCILDHKPCHVRLKYSCSFKRSDRIRTTNILSHSDSNHKWTMRRWFETLSSDKLYSFSSFFSFLLFLKTTCHRLATLIISISEGGTNSWSMHYLAKSQSYRGLKFLMCDTKFMNTCSISIGFKRISVCSKMLEEW